MSDRDVLNIVVLVLVLLVVLLLVFFFFIVFICPVTNRVSTSLRWYVRSMSLGNARTKANVPFSA